MGAFVHHGVRGGFMSAYPFWLFGFGQIAQWIFIIQGVIGMLPDVIEFMGRTFFNVFLKESTHHGRINSLMRWNPAWSWHTEVEDPLFHSLSEDHWLRRGNETFSWLILDPLMIYIIYVS